MSDKTTDWTADDAADGPTDAMAADGPVRVTGAVWQDASGEMGALYRQAEELRRLFGDAAGEV